MQPWCLDELNYGQVKANPPFDVAILPLGATEPHNLHLPYGTDTFQVEVIAARACAIANHEGARVLKLPVLPYGTETNQMKFPLVAADVYATIFQEKDDHAGEMETSMGLAHFPRLVALEQADPGAVKPSRFEAVNRGWVEITRPWHLLTTNSGAGDPRAATAAKGESLTKLVAERIGAFLKELASSPLDEEFPF
jgi:creatinine amidohydrolase